MATLYSHDPFISASAPASFGNVVDADVGWMMLMPTPPVSPSHDNNNIQQGALKVEQPASSSSPPPSPGCCPDDDLDLGLGDILSGVDLSCLPGFGDQDDWLFDDISNVVNDNCQSTFSSEECSELRHDCMWSGFCPAKDYRHENVIALSSSPTDAILSSATPALPQQSSVMNSPLVSRKRLDTFGRPETPLSLSDSEMDGQFTSQEDCSSSSANSSSADESDDDQQRCGQQLPPNIYPVRSSGGNAAGSRAATSKVPVVVKADHSYSHTDHCYHTQRRPTSSSSADGLADFLGIQTPSDSEEEIDVVSLGDVLRMSTTSKSTKSCVVATSAVKEQQTNFGSAPIAIGASSGNSTPIRLKLKVTPTSFNQPATGSSSNPAVLMRKTLPSHPSALVRQQLQLAVASAAQHQQQRSSAASVVSKRTGAKTGSDSGRPKRPRSAQQTDSSDSSSSGRSPRKRCSRTGGSDCEDSCEKRSQHNSMERQRRVDLRNSFDFLRSLLPELETVDRAAKVVILKKAAQFCQGLTQREKQFMAEKDALQKRQEMLRKRIALLQRRR